MNKIGMYTDDEILDFMTEGEGRGFLGRSMYDAIQEILEEKDKEIERLNHIINELEKYIEENIKATRQALKFEGMDDFDKKKYSRDIILFEMILNKLKELKEGGNENE